MICLMLRNTLDISNQTLGMTHPKDIVNDLLQATRFFLYTLNRSQFFQRRLSMGCCPTNDSRLDNTRYFGSYICYSSHKIIRPLA